MAETTGIKWTRSTFNPWIGCTEVSTAASGGGGCDACYARVLDARHRWGGATHWGAGVPRHRTTSTWRLPLQWDRIAALEQQTGKVVAQSEWTGKPGFYPVFPSLCDPFDSEVPLEWRADFFNLIVETPNLTWLLLTKRIGNALKMLPYRSSSDRIFDNVWIGASIVNQQEADRDIPKLLAVPAAKRFISYEPALGPVDFEPFLWRPMGLNEMPGWALNDGCSAGVTRRGLIHQIIVGGESSQGTHKARMFNIQWAYDTLEQCRKAGVACFIKQLGSTCYADGGAYGGDSEPDSHYLMLKDRAGADPAEWPEDLRVQEFPA